MKSRNWNDLSRKLVSRQDFIFTIEGMQEAADQMALDFFGEGVLDTTRFPNPFPVTLSGSLLGGSVGGGIGFDYLGHQTAIGLPWETNVPNFTIPTADPTNPRWDLLVINYTQVGDTPVPQPSDPINTVDLNLHDDFILAIRPGTPSATPSYPTKQPQDIILGGIQVPANATLGTQCLLDLSIREVGVPDVVKIPKFKKEIVIGTVDGSNRSFSLSMMPLSASGVFLFLDGGIEIQSTEYVMSGQSITMTTAPAHGQLLYAFYVVDYNSSTNPLTGMQEAPSGLCDGINDTFTFGLGTPADKGSTGVYIDRQLVDDNAWSLIYTPTFTYIKFLPGSLPQPGQDVYVTYFVNSNTVGLINHSGRPIYETPQGTIDGTNKDFTLILGRPLDKVSTGVLIDGELVAASKWDLVYNTNNVVVRFNSGQPTLGQSIEVNYFVIANVAGAGGITNINNIGTGIGLFASIVAGAANFKSLAPGTGVTLTPSMDGSTITISAPSTGGGYVPYGTMGAPIVINPTVGIVATTDQRQLQIIKAPNSSGPTLITAALQISPGTIIGQEMLLQGGSDSDYIVLESGAGIDCNGPINLTTEETVPFFWRGDCWKEIARTR